MPTSPKINARRLAGLLRWTVIQTRHRGARGSGLFFVDRGAVVETGPDAHMRFGRGVRFLRDATIHVHGVLEVGENVFFNRGCHIVARERVVIGRDCLFGELVSIHDEDHRIGGPGAPTIDGGFVTAPVTIGDNVWIGAKATIVRGVSIGSHSVIGANSVVTSDVPPHSLAVGAPARVIRQLA